MAQKYMSPGVFTTETDLSFLAQGVAGIGALAVGRTPKGPAFVPTFVNGLDAFVSIFGAPDPRFQLTYAAKNYLKNSTSFTVVRVLGHDVKVASFTPEKSSDACQTPSCVQSWKAFLGSTINASTILSIKASL